MIDFSRTRRQYNEFIVEENCHGRARSRPCGRGSCFKFDIGGKMGIRFYCPNGHKLNVKSFLAGKRGICPHCGIKFEIPQQSVAVGKIPTAVREAPQAEAAPIAESVADPFEAIEPVSAPAARPMEVVRGPATTPAATPFTGGGFPQSVGGGAAAGSRNVAQPFGAVPSAPRPTLAPHGAAPDPIAEAPTAVWYVRPASGGQFGPAPGEVLRQWLDQKRIGADSLVWRDGWPDWRPAAAVFPQLAMSAPRPNVMNPASPMAAAAPIPSRPTVAPQTVDDWTEAIIDTKPLQHRHRAPSQQSNVILGISLAIILLGAILAFVLIRMAMTQRNEPQSFNSPPPSAQRAEQMI
jgi:hypothetical protein